MSVAVRERDEIAQELVALDAEINRRGLNIPQCGSYTGVMH